MYTSKLGRTSRAIGRRLLWMTPAILLAFVIVLALSSGCSEKSTSPSAAAGDKPIAAFAASPTSGVPSLTVIFEDKSKGHIISREWDFGDGTTSSLKSPWHTYSYKGMYDVTLRVTGPGGTDTKTIRECVNVICEEPEADFKCSYPRGAAPTKVQFTNRSVGYYDSCLWEFGDGCSSTSCNPTHIYAEGGDFTVKLTVSGACGTSSEIKQALIHVKKRPDGIVFNEGGEAIQADSDITDDYVQNERLTISQD